MISEKTIEMILEAEFSGEFTSSEAVAVRKKYTVQRVGTTRSTSTAHRMMEACANTPALYRWGDNSMTILDVREK